MIVIEGSDKFKIAKEYIDVEYTLFSKVTFKYEKLKFKDNAELEKIKMFKYKNGYIPNKLNLSLGYGLGQFTRNYTQTVKRAADNKRRYAPGEGSIPPVLLSGVSKGVPPLAHDFACKV